MGRMLFSSVIVTLLLCSFNLKAQCCTYTLILQDSWGDGWSGNTITIIRNGIAIATHGAEVTGLDPVSISYTFCEGDNVGIFLNTGGTFTNEVLIKLMAPCGEIFQSAGGTQGTMLFNSNLTCIVTHDVELFAFYDEDGDSFLDEDEHFFPNGSFIYERNNNGEIVSVYSSSGTFALSQVGWGESFELSYELEPDYQGFLVSNSTYSLTIPNECSDQQFLFPVQLIQPYNDVVISLIPISDPVPGFTYQNKLVYRNRGIAAASGTINFTCDDAVTITNISPSTINLTPNSFVHNFSNLQPNEKREIDIWMQVPIVPIVNMGDQLTNFATITAEDDLHSYNNHASLTQTVVNALDPNDINEAHGEKIVFESFSSDEYLYYTIRFENMGTANAQKIVVENILDAKLNSESFSMVAASHDYQVQRIGNEVIYTFEDIQLPPTEQNPDLSKGYILYKIQVLPGYIIGDIIPNTAEIFFDFNPGIITNTFTTEFITSLHSNEITNNTLKIYPNPATSAITVDLQKDADTLRHIALYSLLGQKVAEMKGLQSAQSSFAISSLARGVYILEATTAGGLKHIRKLVVE